MEKVFGTETQLTAGPGGRILTNCNVWSPDGQWLVYDTRSDAEGSVFDGTRIERVHTETGQIKTIYESRRGACCGAATFHPLREEVVFILGPEDPTPEWAYSPSHRQGVIVLGDRPGEAVNLDARDLTPPGTPGALRGGSHVHLFSPDGEWVSFTYNDALADSTQRNVCVAVPGPVTVNKTHPRSHDGAYFSARASRTVSSPRPGSDDVGQALEDGWIGTAGYGRADGTRQRRALAFQGQVTGANGRQFWEVFVCDLSEDIRQLGPGQRRITFTEDSEYPGISGPRHWLRSSPDGAEIAFLRRERGGDRADLDGVAQWRAAAAGDAGPVAGGVGLYVGPGGGSDCLRRRRQCVYGGCTNRALGAADAACRRRRCAAGVGLRVLPRRPPNCLPAPLSGRRRRAEQSISKQSISKQSDLRGDALGALAHDKRRDFCQDRIRVHRGINAVVHRGERRGRDGSAAGEDAVHDKAVLNELQRGGVPGLGSLNAGGGR